jgi:hypothetical protein
VIDSPRTLLEALRARGLVGAGDAVDQPPPGPERPWYISLLLGTAGWIAGLFVLAFVGGLFHRAGALVGAPLLIAAAWGLYRVDREGAFVSQLALALSVAGQVLAVFWLGETFFKSSRSIAGIAFAALALQLALLVLMPNRLHRTMSALFAVIAWAVLVRYGLWDEPVWDARRKEALPLPLALAGWAIVWLPAGGLLYLLIAREAEWMARGWQDVLRPAATGLIVALAITTLVSQPLESFPFGPTSAPGQGGKAIWPLLSAAAALGALVAAFALGSRGLAATCIVAALAHLSHFYYAVGTTLLTKSLTMIAAGVILLWTARSLRRAHAP